MQIGRAEERKTFSLCERAKEAAPWPPPLTRNHLFGPPARGSARNSILLSGSDPLTWRIGAYKPKESAVPSERIDEYKSQTNSNSALASAAFKLSRARYLTLSRYGRLKGDAKASGSKSIISSKLNSNWLTGETRSRSRGESVVCYAPI